MSTILIHEEKGGLPLGDDHPYRSGPWKPNLREYDALSPNVEEIASMDLSQFSLEGKVALITGGSRGIGEATAIAYARAGADVAVTSRSIDELERVAGLVEKEGCRAMAIESHVGRIEALEPLVGKVVDGLGGIDILVNNAGTNHFAPAIDMEERSWDTVMNLDLKGLFFLSQAAARVMRERGGGSIINISSVSGFKVQVPTSHYSIAKAAVHMTTKALALEWSDYGIRVNCIAPGMVDTKLFNAIFNTLPEDKAKEQRAAAIERVPMKRPGEPREIADVCVFLASNAASYMTGQSFAVDGGVLLV